MYILIKIKRKEFLTKFERKLVFLFLLQIQSTLIYFNVNYHQKNKRNKLILICISSTFNKTVNLILISKKSNESKERHKTLTGQGNFSKC